MHSEISIKVNSFKGNNFFQKTLNRIIKPDRRSETLQKNDRLELSQTKSTTATELNDSIIYAKRIQEGMMLKEKHLFRLFPESFLLFKPKDIVSGDFYWFTKIDSKILVAVSDCTGHGIPGAFMSVLGISLLNQIVIEEQHSDVSFILQRLNHKLKKAFSYSSDLHDEQKHHDGMDIALCCIDTETQQLTFAGAFRPVYIASENKLNEYKGSRYPIGGLYLETERNYESQTIAYKQGDKLYLCTDGYADQFGGGNNKKFMTKKFKNELLKTSAYSMKTQQLELNRMLHEWKNANEQTDDILIIGIGL